MRLEDYLSQSHVTKRLTTRKKQPEAVAFSLAQTEEDTVSRSGPDPVG